MSKIRVLPLRAFFPEDLKFLRDRLDPRVELLELKDFTPAALAAAAGDADVLLGGSVAPAVLAAAKKARLLQVPWTGLDTLDLGRLKRSGLKVCNSHSNAGVVAEYAVGLLLSLLKDIPLHDARLRTGDWMRPRTDGKGEFRPPRALLGMAIGFLGYGAIARAAAKLLQGFGVTMRAVAARSRRPAPGPLKTLDGSAGLVRMLAACDVVIIAAPLTPQTRGLLDAAMIERLKPGAVLVNVARAEIVDEAALYEALKSGRLAGAALDAWSGKPSVDRPSPPSQYPFHELPNVVLSPHRAGFAAGTLPHLADVVENLNRLAAGKALINVVDLGAGY